MKTYAVVMPLAHGAVAIAEVSEAIVRESLKRDIRDTDLQALLPFQTSIVAGDTHFHIRNDSKYVVETKYHDIEQGDTLCARAKNNDDVLYGVYATCPGCIAKAKNVVVTHLLSEERIGE